MHQKLCPAMPSFKKKEALGVSKRVCFGHSQAFEVDWDPEPPELDLHVDFLEHSKCRNSSFLRSRYQVCGAQHGIETKAVTMSIDPWTGRLDSPLRFTIVPKDGEKARLELQEGVVCSVIVCYCMLYVIILCYCMLLSVIASFPAFASFRLCPIATSEKANTIFCLRGAIPPSRASRRHPEVPGRQSGRLGRRGASVCLAGERGLVEELPRIG